MEGIKIIGNAILGNNLHRGSFSLEQVARLAKIDRYQASVALARLCGQGIAMQISKFPEDYAGCRRCPKFQIRYRIINKDALAQKVTPRLKSDTIQDRMWKVIRYQRQFTRRDLRMLAEAGYETTKWFTKMLARAGYIKRISFDGWALVRDPGPKRPWIGKRAPQKGGKSKCG